MTYRAGTEWDAEDIVQEAYTRALQYYDPATIKEFSKWFSIVLGNTLRDHKSAERGGVAVAFEEEELEGLPCQMYNDQVNEEILKLIDSKPPQQAEVLHLYFTKGYSAKDVSALVEDITYKAAHQMILRFKYELKELYV